MIRLLARGISYISVFMVLILLYAPIKVHAASQGDSVSNPIIVSFDEVYSKSWNRNNFRKECFNQITIPQDGVLTIFATKPYDDYSQFGALSFLIYDENLDPIWGNGTHDAKSDLSDNYYFWVGMKKGTYYMSICPDYYVFNSVTSTDYIVGFIPWANYEKEPNDSLGLSSVLTLNEWFSGDFGNDGSIKYETSDYWKVYLTEGKTYEINFGNYSNVDKTSTIIQFQDPYSEIYLFQRYLERQTYSDSDINYYIYECKNTGWHYIRLYNYLGKQYSYSIGIFDDTYSPNYIEGKDCSWNEAGGKFYWYEGGYKQGTYDDPQGVIGDGTVRGREIYDAASGGWYWLDACYNGAKAVGKEVWMPYIYQNEASWEEEYIRSIAYESDPGMGDCVLNAMLNHTGKWVRYDENGAMLKGWVTIEGALAELYPNQTGNVYYYDHRTGLMAKGYVTIDGVNHYFDEISGVLQW